MADAGFFKGTTAEQDNRFADKKKKLMKSMKFGDGLDRKVDMSKVNVDSLKPWIAQRITELLGMEDDVIVEFVYNQLEVRHPDPRDMQINLTGFLNAKNARIFQAEMWDLLCSAQDNVTGIPTQFLEQKKEEIKKRQAEQERIQATLKKHEEQIKEALSRERKESDRKARSRSRSVEREKPSNNSQALTKTASPELPGPQIVKQSKELSSKENDVKPETPPTVVKVEKTEDSAEPPAQKEEAKESSKSKEKDKEKKEKEREKKEKRSRSRSPNHKRRDRSRSSDRKHRRSSSRSRRRSSRSPRRSPPRRRSRSPKVPRHRPSRFSPSPRRDRRSPRRSPKRSPPRGHRRRRSSSEVSRDSSPEKKKSSGKIKKSKSDSDERDSVSPEKQGIQQRRNYRTHDAEEEIDSSSSSSSEDDEPRGRNQ